jgi:tetratricopeptide (TPR) repeat protein
LEYHTGTLEKIIEQTQTYKAKAFTARAAFEVYRGNTEQAFYFYNEALKTNPTISDYIKASTGIATLKSLEGFNRLALADLEKLIPLLRHADPLNHFEVNNPRRKRRGISRGFTRTV